MVKTLIRPVDLPQPEAEGDWQLEHDDSIGADCD